MVVLEICIDPLCKSSKSAIARNHVCQSCNGCLHAFCGHPSGEEGFGHGNTCYKCCVITGKDIPKEKRDETIRVIYPNLDR